MLEDTKATTNVVVALQTRASTMKPMQKATNIDDVDKKMDEINKQAENMKQIREALSTPIGAGVDFDADEQILSYHLVLQMVALMYWWTLGINLLDWEC